MRKVLLIGIGVGDPDQLTLQAVAALNRTDVVFALDKGEAKGELLRLRREICARHMAGRRYRFVEAEDVRRDEQAGSYQAGVDDWHERRALIYERLIRDELDEGATGAFLVWGDPSLYDSTVRILDRVLARGNVAFSVAIIPGITSVQALAAAHGIALNEIGAPVHVTTGRRLAAEGLPDVADGTATIVMLDGGTAFDRLPDPDSLEILWGAYLGTPDEILIRGQLSEVVERIRASRAEAKAQKGWIMDIYLLRRIAAG